MSETRSPRGEFEEFVEDIIGFNFRSFRTLRELIIRPNTVFQTYAARDRETYTPSLRLWLGLITIQLLFSVLWGGYGGMLVTQLEAQPANAAQIEALIGVPIEDFAVPYGEAASFLHPLLVGGFTGFSAFLIGAFNKSLGWAARINITFGILTASSLVGLLMLIAVMVSGASGLMSWMTVPIAFVYWITFTRGAPGLLARTRTGAIIKGAVFAAVTMMLVMIGGIIMGIAAFTYAALSVS